MEGGGKQVNVEMGYILFCPLNKFPLKLVDVFLV